MKFPVRLGVVCLARHTFDSAAALSMYRAAQKRLRELEAVDFEFVDDLVVEIEDARRAARRLAAADVDGLVCISGTFHLGHLVLELRRAIAKPLHLWAWNELPYDGGKIRLNSVCGLNLDASNLYKAGIRDYHAAIGNDLDTDWVDALRVMACLRQAKVGLAGSRAHGFFNESVYEPGAFGQMGVLVDHYELDEIWREPVAANEAGINEARVREAFDVGGVSEQQVAKVASLAAKLAAFTHRHGLDGLAIRCWPEFAAGFGISPCAAMSLLQSDGIVLGCEGDVEGVLSMLAHRAVGGETPYLFDFSQVRWDRDTALLWHCGVAPHVLWDGRSKRSLDSYFAGGKGVTADFVLKPGEISILRLDSAGADQRVFLQRATGRPTEQALKGSYVEVQFRRPLGEVLSDLIDHGVAHHASMVYGDFIRPMQILAKLKGWSIIGEQPRNAWLR